MQNFDASARHLGTGNAARMRAMVRNSHRPNALPPGTKLGRYTILETLGNGGFGTTYAAHEELTERRVVIKELLPTGFAKRAADALTVLPRSGDAAQLFGEALERFHADAKMAAGFHHPNLPEVLAYFEANGTAYLVIVWCAGTTLSALLAPDRALTEPDTLAIARPLLGAAEEVHRRGSLHGDIKPENILIRADRTPLMVGFGATLRRSIRDAARAYPAAASEPRGTGGPDGPWTDVQGLGAVMCRCLVGRSPTPSILRAAALAEGRADPMSADFGLLRERASARLAFAIESAMRIRAQDRPQSVAELRQVMTGSATQFASRRAPPIQRTDETANTLLLGFSSSPQQTSLGPPQPRASGSSNRRPHMLRSLTIAAVSILATAGVFHGARNWTARDSGASPSVDGSAKLSPALAPAAAPAQTPPESVESQMRRAEVLEGLAKYHRLMLAAEGNEAGIGNRASAAPAPPKAEDSPSPVSPAERRAPPTQPPDRLHWQDPGYLAR